MDEELWRVFKTQYWKLNKKTWVYQNPVNVPVMVTVIIYICKNTVKTLYLFRSATLLIRHFLFENQALPPSKGFKAEFRLCIIKKENKTCLWIVSTNRIMESMFYKDVTKNYEKAKTYYCTIFLLLNSILKI